MPPREHDGFDSLEERVHMEIAEQRERALGRLFADVVLSPREHEVLGLASHGYTNGVIAATLGVGVETVKTQLVSAYGKLGARGRAHACSIALRQGLIR